MQHPEKKAVRQHKKRPVLLLSVIACALAAAMLLLLPRLSGKESVPESMTVSENPVVTLKTVSRDEISRIDVTSAAGESYTLKKQGDILVLDTDGTQSAIKDRFSEEWFSIAADLTVQGTVYENAGEADDLSELGLNPPQYTARVTLTSGDGFTLSIGNSVPETSYVYGMYSCFEGIYLLDSGIADTLRTPAKQLLPTAEMSIEDKLVSRLTIQKNGTSYVFSFQRNGETASGEMLSPIRYPLSEDATEGILNTLSSLYLGSAAPEITGENAAEYGFSAPMAVIECQMDAGTVTQTGEDGSMSTVQKEASEVRLEIGATQNDYYYTLRYEGGYYLGSRLIFKYLVETDPVDFLTRTPASLAGEELSSAVLSFDGEEIVLCCEHGENEEKIVTLNGEPAAEELLTAFSEKLNAFTVSGDAPGGWTVPGESPHWTLTLTTFEGSKRTLAFYKQDNFFDVICLNGTALHTCYSDSLESFLNALGLE